MIRQRFRAGRTTRIVAWTLAGLTWAAALTARLAGMPTDEGGVALDEAPVPGTVATLSRATISPLPAMADDGLVVIRTAPPPVREPIVVRRVVVGGGGTVTAPPSGGGGSGAGGGGTTVKKKKKVPTSGS